VAGRIAAMAARIRAYGPVVGPPRAESRRGGAPTIRLAAAPARYDAATPRDRAFDFWRRVGKARTTSPTDA